MKRVLLFVLILLTKAFATDFLVSVDLGKQRLNPIFEKGLTVIAELENSAILLVHNNEFDKSLEIVNSCLDSFRKLGKEEYVTKCLLSISLIYMRKKDYDKALEFCFTGLEKAKEIDKLDLLAESYLILGDLEIWRNNYQEAISSYSIASYTYLGFRNYCSLAKCYNKIGYVHLLTGNFVRAKRLLDLSITNYQKVGDNQGCFVVIHNIGVFFLRRGNYLRALELINQSLVYAKRLGKQSLSVVNLNLGLIHKNLGNYSKAEKHLKHSLLLYDESSYKFTFNATWTLFALFEISYEENNKQKMNEYLKRLEQLSIEFNELNTNQYLRLAKSWIMLKSKRIKDIINAIDLIQGILVEYILDFELEIKVILTLCNFYWKELEVTTDETSIYSIISDIQTYVDKLQKIAQSNGILWLNSELSIVKSRLLYVKHKFFEAKNDLILAQTTAEEKHMPYMAQKISNEHDLLLKRINAHENQEILNTLQNRISNTNFDEKIGKILKGQLDDLNQQEAILPIMFLIINEHGTQVYFQSFSDEEVYDPTLISGILFANTTCLEDAFKMEGIPERIVQKDMNILLEFMYNFLFCFVVKGPTYQAQPKLMEIINLIYQNETLWKKLIKSSLTGELPSISDVSNIEHLINTVLFQ